MAARARRKGRSVMAVRKWNHPKSKKLYYRVRHVDPSGKMVERYFEKKKLADDYLANVRVSKQRGTYEQEFGASAKMTVREAWDVFRWLAEERHIVFDSKKHPEGEPRPRPSRNTLYTWDAAFRLDVERVLGKMPVGKIRRPHVRTLSAEAEKRGTKYSAVQGLKVLKMLLNLCVDAEIIPANPALGVKAPEIQKYAPETLDYETLERAADIAHPKDRALVLLWGYGALRWEEIVALRADDFDFIRSVVHVRRKIVESGDGKFEAGGPKTAGSVRSVDLPASVTLEVSRHIEKFGVHPETGLLFGAPAGNPVRRKDFYKRTWKKVRAAGIDIKAKNLRHTGATLARDVSGGDLHAVKERVGHSSITLTSDTYGGTIPEQGRKIAKALDERRAAALAARDEKRGAR